MTKKTRAIGRDQFPALADFVAGYLHQDLQAEHGTPEAAHRAFLSDANADEDKALRRQSRAFLSATRTQSWPVMRDAFASLGGAWQPSSRVTLERFLRSLAAKSTRGRS